MEEKEVFVPAEAEIIEFEENDVITTSGGDNPLSDNMLPWIED